MRIDNQRFQIFSLNLGNTLQPVFVQAPNQVFPSEIQEARNEFYDEFGIARDCHYIPPTIQKRLREAGFAGESFDDIFVSWLEQRKGFRIVREAISMNLRMPVFGKH